MSYAIVIPTNPDDEIVIAQVDPISGTMDVFDTVDDYLADDLADSTTLADLRQALAVLASDLAAADAA